MTRLPRVEIVVRDSGDCRVLKAGDKMAYDHPEILAKRTCAQALSVLAPVAEELARGRAEGPHSEPEEYVCPVEGCGAVFMLRVLSLSEMARQAKGPAPSPSGRRAAPTTRRMGGPLKWTIVGFVVLVLCGVAFGGLVLAAPELLPSGLRERLRAWGLPVRRVGTAEGGQDLGAPRTPPAP